MLPATQARNLAAAYTQTLTEMTTKTGDPLVALAVMAAQQNPGNAGVVVNLRLNGLSQYDYDRKQIDAVTAALAEYGIQVSPNTIERGILIGRKRVGPG